MIRMYCTWLLGISKIPEPRDLIGKYNFSDLIVDISRGAIPRGTISRCAIPGSAISGGTILRYAISRSTIANYHLQAAAEIQLSEPVMAGRAFKQPFVTP